MYSMPLPPIDVKMKTARGPKIVLPKYRTAGTVKGSKGIRPSAPSSVVGDIETPAPTPRRQTSTVAGDNSSLYKGLKQLLNPTERRKAELEEQLTGEGAKRLAPVERERLAFTLQQTKENEALAEYGRRYEVKGEERVNKDPRFWRFQTQVKPMPPDPTTTGNYKEMREKVLMLSLFPNMWNQC